MKTIKVILILLAIVGAVSCKTNEANYRAAYEKAKEKQNSADYGDSALDGIRDRQTPKLRVVDGDSLYVRVEAVKAMRIDDKAKNEPLFGPGELKPYNVVVGEFQQLFNAKSMCNRLKENGYSDAFLLQNGESHYFVVCQDFKKSSEVKSMVEKVGKDSRLSLKKPYPYVLIPQIFSVSL